MLNCCITEMEQTPLRSNDSMIRENLHERSAQPVEFVYDHAVHAANSSPIWRISQMTDGRQGCFRFGSRHPT